jgi:hypothetical protein
MLIIGDDQMDALKRIAMKNFERRMIRHLKEFFPKKADSASEEQARAFIGHAISRAEEYGIVKERDVARYVILSTLFGAHFDSEKRYRWAKQILKRIDLDAEAKLQGLFEATLQAQGQEVEPGERRNGRSNPFQPG